MDEGTAGSSTPQTRRRRPKPQLSCNLCHRRKLKCDRASPCKTCVYRGLSCSYDRQEVVKEPPRERPTAVQAVRNDPRRSEDMQVRVAELEALLVSLRITWTGSSSQDCQWTAIMNRVAELTNYFNTRSDATPESLDNLAPAAPEEPTQDTGISSLAPEGPASSQQSKQALPTTWKRSPYPWLQHFYVPVTYDSSEDDAAPLGTGMVTR